MVVLEPFRRRGLARALVCGAVERLRRDGCDPVFVVADDKDTARISTGALASMTSRARGASGGRALSDAVESRARP